MSGRNPIKRSRKLSARADDHHRPINAKAVVSFYNFLLNFTPTDIFADGKNAATVQMDELPGPLCGITFKSINTPSIAYRVGRIMPDFYVYCAYLCVL